MNNILKTILGVGLAAAGWAPIAVAQPTHSEPASFLIFPCYDATPGHGTIITITNTNRNRLRCPDGQGHTGDVEIVYVYINGRTCRETNLTEFLTPGDTLTVFADVHNPAQDQGWLYVEALDPQTGNPIDFDFLIGSAILVNTGTDFIAGYTPYTFKALTSGPDNDGCDRNSTDLNGDGQADFDNNEYEFFPETLILDRFFEEDARFQNKIAIMTTRGVNDPNVPTVCATALYFNNRENRTRDGGDDDRTCIGPRSRTFCFNCWTRAPLGMLFHGALDLNGDPNELRVRGIPVQTGWLRFATPDPILAVFMDHIETNPGNGNRNKIFEGGRELWYRGALGDDPGEVTAHLPHGG
ncbi:MAG: hypothetical protein HYR85_22070 [Planctomycetes bacterium]|nr:hypothetical protein [Planctomycetota bacterium]MBI3846534.1 hypothetical protein [Planctomycetota bacterium]